ncbi:MAG: Rieske (2Fe-2S) protein [Bdellovibrionaceae bacterium]|nr:Rieske (2Fe-2S) protein [Bdellovibrionales bacterium]MCB9254404.1 Rieske (2Fe-2S) protein [Pseudobdellovibrionaceae bacterium]
MPNFVKVAELDELNENAGLMVELEGEQVAIFLVDGKPLAVQDKCPHRGAPLSEGQRTGTVVRCPWHAAKFDLVTGKVLNPPARRDLHCYKAETRADGVYLSLERDATSNESSS